MSDLTPELAEVCKVIKLDISSEKQHPINMLIAKFQSLLIDNLRPKMPLLDQLLNSEASSSGLMNEVDDQKLARFSRITHQRLSKSKQRNQLHSAVRATQLGGKVRSTFNNERFEDLSPEVIYAEVILLEIQQAVGFIYGSTVRFYMSVIGTGELDQMKEDLIEVVTSTTISGQLGDICLKLCRLSTRQEEKDLAKQYALFGDVQIQQLGVSNYFTLNHTSKLVEIITDELRTQDTKDNGSFLNQTFDDVVAFIEACNTEFAQISEDELRRRTMGVPYAQAIAYLTGNLGKVKAPLEKLRCLTMVTHMLTTLIDDHYQGVDFPSKQSKLQLDADCLINLTFFVLLKAQIVDFFAHLKLANQFATTHVKNSKLGYVASTMEVAIEQVLELKGEDLLPIDSLEPVA